MKSTTYVTCGVPTLCMQVDICSSFGDLQYGVHTLNGLSTSSMQNLNFGKYENIGCTWR